MVRIEPHFMASSMQSSAASTSEQQLALARSGAMALPELMDSAAQLQQRGLAEAAATLYETWIAHTPSPLRHVACFNWGTVLGSLQRHADAERAYRQSLEFKPDFVHALLNLGHQLEHLGRIDEALEQWRRVTETTGAAAETLELRLHALNNQARVLEQQRRFDESMACMVESREL